MWKVVRKNKSYDKRCLKIYYHDKLINTARPYGGWFCWDKNFENLMMHSACRRKVLENLYWLVGKDCSYADWVGRIERWHKGRGVDGKTTKTSQFFDGDELRAALNSFEE